MVNRSSAALPENYIEATIRIVAELISAPNEPECVRLETGVKHQKSCASCTGYSRTTLYTQNCCSVPYSPRPALHLRCYKACNLTESYDIWLLLFRKLGSKASIWTTRRGNANIFSISRGLMPKFLYSSIIDMEAQITCQIRLTCNKNKVTGCLVHVTSACTK